MPFRLPRSLLPICLTGALVLASACRLLTNDLSDRGIPGQETVYDPMLSPGMAAHALVSDAHFRKVIVEIQAVAGFFPTHEAVNSLQRFLEKTLRKPGGIEIHFADAVPSVGNATLTIADVRAIEDRSRRKFSRKDHVAVYVLFVDGKASDTQGARKMLGQAHRSTSIVIYEKTLRELVESSSNNTPLWSLEATILQHEFGHLLGLVSAEASSSGTHHDSAHPDHCSKEGCLMHYTSATAEALGLLQAGPPPLDSACEEDLRKLMKQ